ncbi:MAG: alpha-galactosidase [Kiritimatiellae bacterium]|nr:alpha-galactosidase [Kiritimatiellia bacterium]
MIRIETTEAGFEAHTDAYRLAFAAAGLAGTLSTGSSGEPVLRLSFVPAVDGEPMADLTVESVTRNGTEVDVACRRGRAPVTLRFSVREEGFLYSYRLRADPPFARFALGPIEGAFLQVHNFVPDLQRFDIPAKITTPLRISSRHKAYDAYFQLDHGNYMIPPYLAALYDGKQLVGFGLAEVPALTVPFDASVSAREFRVQFDYGRAARAGEYASPLFAVMLAAGREGILDAYRALVEPGPPGPAARPPAWWLNPLYTTWGDQVYTKHLEEGAFSSEAGSERHCSAALIDAGLKRLENEGIRPGTLVIDEGWSAALGDWAPADERFGGSLAAYIARKHEAGYRVGLYFNPFLVAADSRVAEAHPDWLVRDADGNPRRIARSGREHHLFDWSASGFRAHIRGALAHMVGPDGLNADAVKVSGTKFLPAPEDRHSDPGYGRGEQYLLAVLRDIHAAVKAADPDAPVFLACLNPLFGAYFDIVRAGNTSEVNHDLHVLRAATASRLLPGKPVDTDDWAAYQKVIGTTTFIKALAGIPNIFSAFYRGDGRLKVQGAMGGNPLRISKEQYHVISTAWRLYEMSRGIDRARLHIDYERMEFSTRREGDTPFVRTYQGGNILAVYNGPDIYLTSLLDTKAVIDLPAGRRATAVQRCDRNGRTENTPFHDCKGNRILFDARSCRNATLYYHIRGGE